jgi:hypothetical protein
LVHGGILLWGSFVRRVQVDFRKETCAHIIGHGEVLGRVGSVGGAYAWFVVSA